MTYIYSSKIRQFQVDAWNNRRSLSGTISCVTDRIRFLPVTMTGRFSNFNSISYTEDRHELRLTGTKCLPDTMSGTGEIFISGAGVRTADLNLDLMQTCGYWIVFHMEKSSKMGGIDNRIVQDVPVDTLLSILPAPPFFRKESNTAYTNF